MVELSIQLHPSIRSENFPEKVKGSFENETILEAIQDLLAGYPDMADLVLENNNIKPGLLVFAEKTELTSMNLLDNTLDEDLSLRVVPILHGG